MCVTKGENLHFYQRTVWSQWRGNAKSMYVNSTLIRVNMPTHIRSSFIFYLCTALQYFQFYISKACLHVCAWGHSSRQGGVDNFFGILTVIKDVCCRQQCRKTRACKCAPETPPGCQTFFPKWIYIRSKILWTRNFQLHPHCPEMSLEEVMWRQRRKIWRLTHSCLSWAESWMQMKLFSVRAKRLEALMFSCRCHRKGGNSIISVTPKQYRQCDEKWLEGCEIG